MIIFDILPILGLWGMENATRNTSSYCLILQGRVFSHDEATYIKQGVRLSGPSIFRWVTSLLATNAEQAAS